MMAGADDGRWPDDGRTRSAMQGH